MPGFGDEHREDFDDTIDAFVGRKDAKAHPNRGAGEVGADAQRRQNV